MCPGSGNGSLGRMLVVRGDGRLWRSLVANCVYSSRRHKPGASIQTSDMSRCLMLTLFFIFMLAFYVISDFNFQVFNLKYVSLLIPFYLL